MTAAPAPAPSAVRSPGTPAAQGPGPAPAGPRRARAEPAAPSSPSAAPSSPAPGRGELIAWMLRVTRPVLAPLLGSTLARIADLLAGVGLFALGAWAVVVTGRHLAGGPAAPPAPPVGTIVAIMAGLSLLKAALRYAEQFLGHFVAFKALELLRAEIFRALIPRAPRVMATARSGDLMARATKDVDRIEVFFAHTFAPMVSAVVVPATVLVLVGARVSWAVAGAALPFLLAALLVAPAAGRLAALASSRAAVAARSRLTEHVTDSVQGMSEVVGYGRTAERLAATAGLDDDVASAFRPASLVASLRRGAIALLVLAGPAAALAVGAPGVGTGAVDAAALAAAVAALARLSECVRAVEESAGALSNSFASAERVYEVVHAPIELPDGREELAPAAGGHEVVWDDVVYSYPNASAPALRGVSLRARAGRWTCLVGVSGSGKTTLAQLALRFDDPQGGRILVGGRDVRELTGDSLRREVVLVSQRAHLFRAGIADNVRLAAPGATDAEVEAACRAAGVHEDIVAMDRGYDTPVGERGLSLSGGQRQRLALARALLTRPGVIVLDEFTSHLDPGLDAAVRDAVRRWAEGVTVVEITHRLRWVERADRVVVIDAGLVVADGEPAELLAVDGPLRRLAARDAAGDSMR